MWRQSQPTSMSGPTLAAGHRERFIRPLPAEPVPVTGEIPACSQGKN
jgi:hypothetical protein